MRSQAGRLAALAVVALAGCATTKKAAEPQPWKLVVHVDTVEAATLPKFAAARIKFLEHIKPLGASDLRGTYLQIGDHTFWSVFPYHHFSDIVQHGREQERRMRNIDKQASDEYDRDSDTLLQFPHSFELWNEMPNLEYGSPEPLALLSANVGTVVIEEIKPNGDYWDLWPEIAKGLAQVKYPLKRVTYFSNFGTGRTISFWLAPSEAVLKAAPTLAQALATAVGEARAAELIQKWRDAVQWTDTQPLLVRHEMTSPP